jgi:predicted PurR-regulated permease PerM
MNGPTSKQEKIIWHAVTTLSFVALGTVVIGGVWLLGSILILLKPVLLPLAIAGVVAYLLHPVVCFLEDRMKMRRKMAVIVLFVVSIIVCGGFLYFVIPKAYQQVYSLVKGFPDMTASMKLQTREWLNEHQDLQSQLDSIQAKIQQNWPSYSDQATDYAFNAGSRLLSSFGLILGFAFIPLYVFYFLRDQAGIERGWRDYLPIHRSRLKDELILVITEINKHLIVFFRGQIIVAIILGILTGIGLSIIGLNYSLLIGLTTGTLSIIPYLGVISSLLPALAIAYVQSDGAWSYVLLTAGVFTVVQMCEGMFVSPYIMGERTGLHPMTVIVSILVWSILLGGLFGAILAVPLTATLKVLMYRYVWRTGEEKGA